MIVAHCLGDFVGEDGQKRKNKQAFVVLDVEVSQTYTFDKNKYVAMAQHETVFKTNPGLLAVFVSQAWGEPHEVMREVIANLVKNRGLPRDEIKVFARHPWVVRDYGKVITSNPSFEDYCIRYFLDDNTPVCFETLCKQPFFAATALHMATYDHSLCDDIFWNSFSENPGIPFSTQPDLFRRFRDKWRLTSLLQNPAFCISTKEVEENIVYNIHYRLRFCESHLMANTEFRSRMIDLCDYVAFEFLSKNVHIEFTADVLREHASRWNWTKLSANTGIKFTRQLLFEFVDKWDWDVLSLNKALFKEDPSMVPYVIGFFPETVWDNESIVDADLSRVKQCPNRVKAVIQRRRERDIKIREDSNPQDFRVRMISEIEGQCVLADNPEGTDPMERVVVPPTRIDTPLTETNMLELPCVKLMIDAFQSYTMPEETMCSICLQRSTTDTLVFVSPCAHIFHKKCIDRCDRCPVCRGSCKSKQSWEEAKSVFKRMKVVIDAVEGHGYGQQVSIVQ